MRRSYTTYGQKGGEGPNTGKKASYFEAVYSGEKLKKRFFDCKIPENADVMVAVHVGLIHHRTHESYNCIWTVAINAASMPDYVNDALARNDGKVVLVPGKRVK